MPIHYIAELRERKLGAFEGKHTDVWHSAIEKSGLGKARFKPEGGESYVETKERVQRLLDALYKTYKGKTVLLVTHGGFIRMLLGILLKKPIEEAAELKPSNASVTIIEIGDVEHKIHQLNSVEHL